MAIDPEQAALLWTDKLIALLTGAATAFAVVYGAIKGAKYKVKQEDEEKEASDKQMKVIVDEVLTGPSAAAHRQSTSIAKTLAAANAGVVVVPYSEELITDVHNMSVALAGVAKTIIEMSENIGVDGRKGIPVLLSEEVKQMFKDFLRNQTRISDALELQADEVRRLRRMRQGEDDEDRHRG